MWYVPSFCMITVAFCTLIMYREQIINNCWSFKRRCQILLVLSANQVARRNVANPAVRNPSDWSPPIKLINLCRVHVGKLLLQVKIEQPAFPLCVCVPVCVCVCVCMCVCVCVCIVNTHHHVIWEIIVSLDVTRLANSMSGRMQFDAIPNIIVTRMEWNLPPYYRPVYPFGIANQQPQLPADDHHDREVDQLG